MARAREDFKVRFPRIDRIRLNDFDLYKRNKNVEIDLSRNVFCLIGANGLGKSTFLTTAIYALTSGIPRRSKGFNSSREYFIEATRRDFREDYFDGRLSDEFRELVSVSIKLSWSNLTLEITRPIFGSGDAIHIWLDENGDQRELSADNDGEESVEELYRQIIVEQTGLRRFEQYAFLIHFICSFDEDRHLLLWNGDALTNALYLAFGTDIEDAENANSLRRNVEKYDSRARNAAYAAKQSRDAAAELKKIIDGGSEELNKLEDELREHERLQRRLLETQDRVARKDTELSRIDAEVSNYSAALAELQLEYDETYFSRAADSRLISHHPLIRTTIESDSCAVCGTGSIGAYVKKIVEDDQCPICRTHIIEGQHETDSVEKLRSLDSKIEATRDQLGKVLVIRRRIREELDAAEQNEQAAGDILQSFLSANPEVKKHANSSNDASIVHTEIDRHYREAEKFKLASKNEYKERDKARKELMAIERKLKLSFDDNSLEFTSLFRKYAEEFIGLSVDIELFHITRKNRTGFELLLSLEHQTRSLPDSVSESQRFFLDIALRMALSEFMSGGFAPLLVDTPEGSLDISYEAQAGQMLSNFASRGNQLIMTANLRSSELVLQLANRRKSAGMQLERMTEWTDLSEVQQRQETLFTRAYQEIEKAME